jgi:hypothetical protein
VQAERRTDEGGDVRLRLRILAALASIRRARSCRRRKALDERLSRWIEVTTEQGQPNQAAARISQALRAGLAPNNPSAATLFTGVCVSGLHSSPDGKPRRITRAASRGHLTLFIQFCEALGVREQSTAAMPPSQIAKAGEQFADVTNRMASAARILAFHVGDGRPSPTHRQSDRAPLPLLLVTNITDCPGSQA